MRKRISFIMVTVCVLLITGCGASNSAEDSTGADSQMTENAEQNSPLSNDALSYSQLVDFGTSDLPDAYAAIR